jgi:hypothetical protein
LFAQISLTGTLVDAITDEHLIGASIFAQETKEGVVSDLDCYFVINVRGGNKHLKSCFSNR